MEHCLLFFLFVRFFFCVDDICVPWNTHILLIYTCTMSCPKKTNNSCYVFNFRINLTKMCLKSCGKMMPI
jgi:hypothetical protein